MAEPISIQQLKDASEDAISLAGFINKPENVMIPRRLASDINSLQYYLEYMKSYSQRSYETYDEMVSNASNLSENVSVFVTNDADSSKNGIYTYNGNSFVRGEYQPENAAKEFVEAKLGELEIFDGKVRAQDVSTSDGSTQDVKNTEFRGELDALPFEDGFLSDNLVLATASVSQRQVNMGFSDIAAIKAIIGANIGMRVYSKTLASNFIFKATSTSPVNGGTVLQGVGGVWEMEDKDTYFASWFATPNAQTNQALKLQAGYAYATSKGKPFIVDDVFWIDARAQLCNLPQGDRCGILILDDSDMRFTAKGHIKALPNNYSNYHIMIACNDVKNYDIYKPLITGDRLTHDYTGAGNGEWGYGLTIYESSNGTVTNPRINETTGDSLYIGKAWGSMLTTVPKDVTVSDPIMSGTRRNGYSLTAGDNVQVLRPVFAKVGDSDGIGGKFPKACIDVEPEGADGTPSPYIRNCIIDSPVCKDSYAGIYIYALRDNQEMTLHIKGTTVFDNISNTCLGGFHGGANGVGEVNIDHVYYKTTPYVGLNIGWNANSALSLNIGSMTSAAISSLIMNSTLNGAFVGKKLGNFNIDDINLKSDILFNVPKDATYTVDGYRMTLNKASPWGLAMTTSTTSASFGGKNTYIDSSVYFVHKGFSKASNTMPNKIWQDPSVSAADSIFIQTATDFRLLRVGLHYKTVTIGNGCNINGLSIKHATGVHTQASCKTLGGWLEFQNIEGGNTRITNSYGVWTFL